MSDQNANNDPAGGGWHFDKRIPVALIITLGLQTAGVFFWMGQLSVRIDQLENRALSAATNSSRLTRLEVQLEQVGATLKRIEQRMERQ